MSVSCGKVDEGSEVGPPVRGFACAIQPHREVRPESGLSIYEIYDMNAYRIMTPFWARRDYVHYSITFTD